MSSIRRMDHMTWPEIEASKSKPVIVPIGSTEQHSQHLPLGVDAMMPAMCLRISPNASTASWHRP